MHAFETKVSEKQTTRQQMCKKAKKRVEGNTVQKLTPLCASSSPVTPRFVHFCTLAFTEQHTGQAPPAFSSSSFSLVVANPCTCLISQKNRDLWECLGNKKERQTVKLWTQIQVWGCTSIMSHMIWMTKIYFAKRGYWEESNLKMEIQDATVWVKLTVLHAEMHKQQTSATTQ